MVTTVVADIYEVESEAAPGVLRQHQVPQGGTLSAGRYYPDTAVT